MKKKLILFFLCLTLLFATACGGEKQPQATPTPTESPTPSPSPSPSPTPTPVNAAKETLHNLETAWESLLNWNSTGNLDVSKGFGYDVTMDVSVNQMLMSLLGMADFSNFSIEMSMDMSNELLFADVALNLNKEELFDMVLFFDYETLIYNIPKYSSAYAGMTQTVETDSTVSIPDTEALVTLYKDFITDLFDTFQIEEGFTDNASIERNGYKVTGQKFTVSASVSDINAILNKFGSTFLELYPSGEIEITEIPEDEISVLYFSVYKGADGTFAWELCPDTAKDEPVGFLSAENGFCLFTTTDGATEVLLRSEKSSSVEGTVYFPNDGDEFALNYTLSDNSISLADLEDTIAVSIGWQFSTDYISLDLSVTTEEIGLTYQMVADGKKAHMDIAVSSYGTQLAKISADYTIREFQTFTMPESYLDEEAWEAQLDKEALQADIDALVAKYPILETLFDFAEDPDDSYYDDWTGEDYYDDWYDDTPVYDPTATYINDFMNMTGYAVDEYGDVFFEALESEVLALGIPSTALITTEITADQRQALINYVTTVFANDYEQSGSFYYVYGNVADNSVESQYFTEYYITDNTNGYNVVDLYFEAVTGYFHAMDIYSSSRDEAFRMANEILALLGGTGTLDTGLDATTLEEGCWIGDFLIYGYDYGAYFCITIY